MLLDSFDAVLGYPSSTLLLLLPQLILLTGGLWISIIAVTPALKKYSFFSGLLTLFLTTVSAFLLLLLPITVSDVHLSFDFLSRSVVLLIALFALLLLVYVKKYLQVYNLDRPEFYIMVLLSILGMMVMAVANSLLVVYLGIELFSLSLCGLIASNHAYRADATEAAMKYFVMTAIASGFFLYGSSFLFSANGSIGFDALIHDTTSIWITLPMLWIATLFIVAGLMFKVGAVPFHWWVADVYAVSPIPVIMLISGISKIATVVVLLRIITQVMEGMEDIWKPIFIVVACLSLLYGSLVALQQANIYRLLGYSTISHMGFLLLGFISNTPAGQAAALFYVITYAFTILAALVILTFLQLQRNGHCIEEITDLKGLASIRPGAAIALLIILFSMAGIPPFVGFLAKWNVLASLLDSYPKDIAIFVAVYAVICSVISAVYYLRLVRLIYFEAPPISSSLSLSSYIAPVWLRGLLGVHVSMLLLFSIFFSPLVIWCEKMIVG